MKVKKLFLTMVTTAAYICTLCNTNVFAEKNNNLSLQNEKSCKIQEIVDALRNSKEGIPSSVSQDDIDFIINEGGEEGLEALEYIYSISRPVEEVLSEMTIDRKTKVSNHYSYSYDVETSEVLFDSGEKYDYEPVVNKKEGIKKSTLKGLNSNVSNYAFPYDWYEPDPQNYDNTSQL
ncbi:MAG: hypothetical protein ACI4KB_13555 [Oscillospiraceae bacterium]